MSVVLPRRAPAGSPKTPARQPLARALWEQGLAWGRNLLFYGCLGILGALLLAGCLISGGLANILSQRHQRVCGRALISFCARIFFRLAGALGLIRLDLSALDALNAERGLIIAPNHPSMLDALLITSRVRRTGCIMKAGLRNNPFLGAGARLAGYIGNDSVNGMIRQAADDLASGGKILIFPEATRSSAPTSPNPLTAGIALIAQRAGVPIQTVLIETDSLYLSKGWPLWRPPVFPLRYRVTLGPRVVVHGDRDAALAAMHRYYAGALAGDGGRGFQPKSGCLPDLPDA